MEVNKEHFEHWLYSQPRDRKLDLFSRSNCALCTFFRETTNLHVRASFDICVDCYSHECIRIPYWFKKLVNAKSCPLTSPVGYDNLLCLAESVQTMGWLQDRFREIFPIEKEEEAPVVAVSCYED